LSPVSAAEYSLPDRTAERDKCFKEVRSIVFEEKSYKEGITNKQFTVTAFNEVKRLISFIRLQLKHPCLCEHPHKMILEQSSSKTEISFCAHCFFIYSGPLEGDYYMPQHLYQEFRAQVHAHAREKWEFLSP
jgi:hypothetical protein